MPSYTPDPTGGFTIFRDDGTSFRSAIPVGMPNGIKPEQNLSAGGVIGGPPQVAMPSPEMIQAAQQPGPQPTADASDVIHSALNPSANPGASPGDMIRVAPQIQSGPAGAATALPPVPAAQQGGDGDKIRAALGGNLGANPLDAGQSPAAVRQAEQQVSGGGKAQGAGGAVFATPQGATSASASNGHPPGAYRTKKGWQNRAQSVQATQVPKEVLDGLQSSTDVEIAGRTDEIQAMREQANNNYTAAQLAQQDQREMAAAEALREQGRQQRVQQQMDKVQQASADAASMKIDRDRIWANGGREIGLVGTFLGGLGGYGPGGNGRNDAMIQLNKTIDDDLKEQEMNLNNKHANVKNQQNILGSMRDNFGDERAAFTAAKAIKLEDFARTLEVNTAKYKDPLIQAQGQQAIEQIRQKSLAMMGEAQKTATATSQVWDPGGIKGLPTVTPAVVKDAAAYGDDVEKAKLNELDASVANAQLVLAANAGKPSVPGIGPENMLTRGWKATADFVAGDGSGEKSVYTPEERGNRQTFNFMKADIKHAVTGAGMPESESKRLDIMIEGAQSFSDLAKAVGIIKQRAAAHRAFLAGGHDPAAVNLYNQRRYAATNAATPAARPRVTPAGEE